MAAKTSAEQLDALAKAYGEAHDAAKANLVRERSIVSAAMTGRYGGTTASALNDMALEFADVSFETLTGLKVR